MAAIDSALEMVAIVFTLAAMVYSLKLIQLTANAQIVAISKPKTVFRFMSFAFASLLLSPIFGFVSDTWKTLPLVHEVQDILLILTAFFSTTAIYTALYFYRTPPEKAKIPSKPEITN